MTNFITRTGSKPSGLAYVAYGDPERYAQVKNQIRNEIYLGSAKLDFYNPELIKDCISKSLTNSFKDKYDFISSKDIGLLSSEIYNSIHNGVDSISSYSDSVLNRIPSIIEKKFPFITKSDSQLISDTLIKSLDSANTPAQALGFINSINSESSNDLTKIGSLPDNSAISLKNTLDSTDFITNAQSIASYLNDSIASASNLTELVSNAISGLIGYPTDAASSPSDANGDGAQNLENSQFMPNTTQSTLFSSSILNLNLVAALNYDPNKDPFNPGPESIYNMTPTLQSGPMDPIANLGQAFRATS